jgi:hypothetical protein
MARVSGWAAIGDDAKRKKERRDAERNGSCGETGQKYALVSDAAEW